MERRRVVNVRLRTVELLEEVQLRGQCRAARYRRRARVDGVPAIRADDRLALSRVVTGHICKLDGAALGVQIGDHALRYVTFVECLRAALGNRLERGSEICIPERIPRVQRLTIAKEQGAAALPFEKRLSFRRQRRL